MNVKLLAITLLAASMLAAAAEVPIRKSKAGLADDSGKTLYTYDKDSGEKSACNGPCAQAWPPAKAAANAKPQGEFSIVTRDDGSKQWAYKGKPLYTHAQDKNAGDKTGEGQAGWRVATPK